MSDDFQVTGDNDAAPFTLKVHRGEGMVLLAMDWRDGRPPDDFVGFTIEARPPREQDYAPLLNRLAFRKPDGSVEQDYVATTRAPIQKFRWIHFPWDKLEEGEFGYRVTPAFMDEQGELSHGEAQEVTVELLRETYPKKLNIAFTRGFVSSQAFVRRYKKVDGLLPEKAAEGFSFVIERPDAEEAYEWMGWEARKAIIDLLDEAIADGAEVRVVAFDLNLPELVDRLKQMRGRAKVIIDDSDDHHSDDPADKKAEDEAEELLVEALGGDNVKRQKMGNLQHNKSIVVDGPNVKAVVGGSTNFSWRGFFVQSNNAVIVRGEEAVRVFSKAFDCYWEHDTVDEFGATPAVELTSLGVDGVNASVAFSPHRNREGLLDSIAEYVEGETSSSLFYSLAFLSMLQERKTKRGTTPEGRMLTAIRNVVDREGVFVYGISDTGVDALELQKPDGEAVNVHFDRLVENLPEPFKSEPRAGQVGVNMHHKFVVVDFDKPTARVYTGSYNFSTAADVKNGENLLVIDDRRIAVAYMVEALRIFDHYHFRVARNKAEEKGDSLVLATPPRKADDAPWWEEYYTEPIKIRDREMFR